MKRQNYILKIDNPCQQDWSSMTKKDTGKFCSLCSKTVVDFTKLSDSEIIQVVEKTSGKLCGRLSKAQLGRILEDKQIRNSSRLYKILTGLLLVGATENSLAAEKVNSNVEITSFTDDSGKPPAHQLQNEEELTDSLKNIIQGNVIDANTHEPLPFALILIKDTKTGVITDLDGKFKLVIPDSLFANKISLVIAFVGYERTEITVDVSEFSTVRDILVIPAEQITQGEIHVVGGVRIVKKKRWWQFWRK